MSNGFETLVTSLERRYDYQSARTIAREALATAGLKEADKYSAADLQKFADGLAKVGSDLGAVYEALGVRPTGTEAPAPKAEAKAEEKEEAKPAAKAEKKEEAKPAAKAEKKDEAKADAGDAAAKGEGAKGEAPKDEAKKPAAKKAPAKKK